MKPIVKFLSHLWPITAQLGHVISVCATIPKKTKLDFVSVVHFFPIPADVTLRGIFFSTININSHNPTKRICIYLAVQTCGVPRGALLGPPLFLLQISILSPF